MRVEFLGGIATLAMLLSVVAHGAETVGTRLTIVTAADACESASLGDVQAKADPTGRFVFTPSLTEPRDLIFECGGKFSFYLSPGDDLTVHLRGKEIAFEGSGAAANRYMAAPSAVSTKQFMAQAPQPWETFAPAWAKARRADDERLAALADSVTPAFVAREHARIAYQWALGQVLFPFIHWRETDVPKLTPDGSPATRLGDVPVEAPEWSALSEYQAFIAAYLHEQARIKMASDPALRTGDNRWLRAELAAALELKTPSLRLEQASRVVETHVTDDGARDIEPTWKDYLALDPPADVRERIEKAIADDRAHRDGHRIEVYQTVDGVPLEIHVLTPTGDAHPAGATPAMLWFHGGSGTEGTWWHCPIFCKALRENGVIVLAVELRTGNRFDTGPLEYLDDASAAWRWTVAHATELGIDRNRIGVAGFSSGATLALITATRGIDSKDGKPAQFPAAVIAMGGCANPIGPEEDGWFRRRVAERGAPSDFSPIDRVKAGEPPLLAVHASEDEYCSSAQMRTFVDRYQAAGNDATLVWVPDVGHFFPFYFPPGVEQVRGTLTATLKKWGWQ
jgi:acetyl esterase/lipase